MMIHTALKSSQAVETRAVKPLKCENYITRAIQIPDMMIHTALKSAQAVETKAVKPLKCENDTPKV
jgi:hypothetical protein